MTITNTTEFTGTLALISDIEEVGKNNTPKCYIIVTEKGCTDKEYPNSIKIDVFGDKTEYLSSYHPGDIVKITYNVKISEYNGKHYNNVSLWKIEKAETNTDEGMPF